MTKLSPKVIVAEKMSEAESLVECADKSARLDNTAEQS